MLSKLIPKQIETESEEISDCFSFKSAGESKVLITKYVIIDGKVVATESEELSKLAATTWFKKKLFDLLISN